MSSRLTLGLLVAACLALALRCPQLAYRPMHNDEAVNAIKFGQLWEHGVYKYDPNEHHGPSLFYATLAVARLTSSPDFEHLTEVKLRLIPIVFALGLIVLLPLISDGLGKCGVVWAAVFTAISPAMVFYSRYYIHEMLLVFFTFLALAAGWRYWRSRKLVWALLAGAALGLMHSTKETFVITLVPAFLALVINQVWNCRLDATAAPTNCPGINFRHMIAALLVWLIVWATLFSSFFTNFAGLADSFRTYAPWLTRAGGESPHIHPWHFYFHRLLWFHAGKGPVWSEALILTLALVGAVAAFRRRGLADASASFVRFLALYTFGLTVAYSFVAYKTPWCLLSFWHGMVLLAGVGAVVVTRAMPACLLRGSSLNRQAALRATLTLVLLLGAAHLAWQAWLASIEFAADRRNPYVYAQTSPNTLNLVGVVEALAEVHPQGRQMVVKVIAPESEYWPLPWYLRGFRQAGWWGELPSDPYAPVMIVSARLHAGLDDKKTHQMPEMFELRPQEFFELYVQTNLWRTYLEKKVR